MTLTRLFRTITLATLGAGIAVLGACTVKPQASDTICIPDQKDRCSDCTKENPSDTRSWRGWHSCSHDGKSFGACAECQPVVEGMPESTPPPEPAPSPKDSKPAPTSAPPTDAGAQRAPETKDDCAGPLAFGDLAVVEIMIASGLGPVDLGEWFEVANMTDCPLQLRGLHVESPRANGGTPDTLDIDDDLVLQPGGTFVVADSVDVAASHGLPGVLLAWSSGAPETLANVGPDTIRLSLNGDTIDSLTFDATSWFDATTIGKSVAFSAYCEPNARSSWGKWAFSNALYSSSPVLNGTPNQDNTDIACPGQ